MRSPAMTKFLVLQTTVYYITVQIRHYKILINCKAQTYVSEVTAACRYAWNYIFILYLVSGHRSFRVKRFWRVDENRCYIIKGNFDISYGIFSYPL